jgi:hypothetical protein
MVGRWSVERAHPVDDGGEVVRNHVGAAGVTRLRPHSLTVGVHETAPQSKVVICAGEIDTGSCAKLIDALEQVGVPGTRHVHVDLGAVSFIDSTGIGITFDIVPEDALTQITRAGPGDPLQAVENGRMPVAAGTSAQPA